jgi:hypothetical protein
MLEDEPLDLSPLDPTADRPRFEAAVRSIAAEAAARRAAKVIPLTPLSVLAAWRRPLAAAATIVGVASAAALASTGRQSASAGPSSVAVASGVPSPLADALEGGSLPGPERLVFSSYPGASR